MPIEAIFKKAPGEVLDYDVDFSSALLETGDIARTVDPVEFESADGLPVLDAVWVAETGRAKVWVSGGVDGRPYLLSVWLNTAGGRRLEVDFQIIVRE